MALSMSRPWKHPDSGFYWFRKRVPDDLRNLLGKREERFSLGTRDPIEAKRLHVLKLAEVDERWSNLRAGQRPLSSDDIARLASEIGDQLRRQLEADPYQPLRWDVEIGARLWTASDTREFYTDITEALSPADQKRLDQQKICYVLVDERLSGRGVAAHHEDRERLARAALLSGDGQAACISHGDEVAEMLELHHNLPCLVSMGPAYKVFLKPSSWS
jgi:hypothetical protein